MTKCSQEKQNDKMFPRKTKYYSFFWPKLFLLKANMVLGTSLPALDTAQSEDSTTWPICNYTVHWGGGGSLHPESLT
jgi:hypothetical protein